MRVLITGGTGFFGQAMMRRLIELGDTVCCLSRSESKQARLRQQYPTDRAKWFVGDVRDRSRVRRALRDCDLVIHAAALKRIEVGQFNPSEMVKTNVLGTTNVVEEAEDAGVRCVVLSTDKACEPISPYGYSKALAENIALNSGAVPVRYGNIWRSTGSLVPTWERILASDKPVVRVTDPRCSRFFMRVEEAVDLVLDAAERMPSEVVIPETLPAYYVGDLMTAMGVQFFEEVGLPAYEKLHEKMRPDFSSDMTRRMSVDELKEELK